MTVQCVDCARCNLRAAERMAQHGFGVCELKRPWEYVPLMREHDCAHFGPAPVQVARERLEWIERKVVRRVGE